MPSASSFSSFDLLWSNAGSGLTSLYSESSKSEEEHKPLCGKNAVDRGECKGSGTDNSQVRVREVEGRPIVDRDYIDLSAAVATPKGLVTPMLRNAGRMGFLDIEMGLRTSGRRRARVN